MNLKSLYECEIFSDPTFAPRDAFSFVQRELQLKDRVGEGKYLFDKLSVEYTCRWKKQKDWDKSKPTIIVPIRDNSALLRVTCANFQEHNLKEICNVIVVDDRSEEKIEGIVLENEFSYLRVDNDKGFNFAMLNNIAAKISHFYGCEEIICWNSDLWCADRKYLIELLRRHRKYKSTVSGSKLVYPPLNMSKVLLNEDDSENIKRHFPTMTGGKWRNTVQFGGDVWYPTTMDHAIRVSPTHYMRFAQPSDPRVNCDRGLSFVTCALHVWDLKFFIAVGGFNPSLSKNFQDVDLCLKVLENNGCPMYFGKDIYFYHDESFNFYNNRGEEKEDHQMWSDHVLFGKLWNDKLANLVS
tara:strand:- start:1623 stop:2684 length:1062 start_codon:yes stop_codon:yes gene_type:complete